MGRWLNSFIRVKSGSKHCCCGAIIIQQSYVCVAYYTAVVSYIGVPYFTRHQAELPDDNDARTMNRRVALRFGDLGLFPCRPHESTACMYSLSAVCRTYDMIFSVEEGRVRGWLQLLRAPSPVTYYRVRTAVRGVCEMQTGTG